MVTTTTADEMPEIRLQRKDERKANEGITAPLHGYVRFYVKLILRLIRKFPQSPTAIYL